MKTSAKEMGLLGIRINSVECLVRCKLGPTIVVHTDGIWCHLETIKDACKALEQLLKGGKIVQRILLKAEK